MSETASSARRDARREAILDVARQVFFEEGYAAASMSTIAARLGGSKGTLYNYFKSKEELFEAYIRETCARMGGPVFELPVSNDHEDVRKTLVGLGERFLQFLLTDMAMRIFQHVTAEAHRSPDLARIFYEAGPQFGIGRVARYLQMVTDAGLIDPPDCEVAAQHLITLFRGHIYFRYSLNLITRPTPAQITVEIERAVSLFLDAYAIRPA